MRLRKPFILILLTLSSASIFSQVTLRKQRDIGTSSADYFSTFCLTKDGGRLEAGSTVSDSSGDKTEPSRGGYDYWIVKLDSKEKIQWNKTIGGSIDDILTAVIQTSDGGYLIGGYSTSGISGDKTDSMRGAPGDQDYWIVKLDSTGNIEWDRTFGGKGQDDLTAMIETSDGGYLIGGYSTSGISGDKTDTSRGYYDFWIIQINKSGKLKWQKTIGGNGSDEFVSLAQTADGGYMLAGTSGSNKSGEKSENNHSSDYWLVKTDSLGNKQWDKTIWGGDPDELGAAQPTKDGGYILGGSSSSSASGYKSHGKKGFKDFWIVKTDSAGNKQWDNTIGSNSYSYLHSLQQTADGGYIVGGSSGGDAAHDKTEPGRGGSDFWVVKIAASGRIQWDKTIGGSDQDILYTLKETSKNKYTAAGYSVSGISGDKTLRTKGYADYWSIDFIYKKPSFTSVPSYNIAQSIKPGTELVIYPNPVSDILFVKTRRKEVLTLTDVFGNAIISKAVTGKGEFDISNLSEGVYYVKNNTTTLAKKIIVIH